LTKKVVGVFCAFFHCAASQSQTLQEFEWIIVGDVLVQTQQALIRRWLKEAA
jgi:hypothetical protein